MSYCRWSSDNWRCDLYCYGDVSGGYTTHVGSNRVVGEIPTEPGLSLPLAPDFMDRHKAVMKFLDTAERAQIGGPFDGATFNDPDLESFRDRLLELRAAGYHFPDEVLQEVDEEIADEGTPE